MPIRVRSIRLIEDDGDTTLIEVETTLGSLQILGECDRLDRALVVSRAHIQGLHPGALGRQGLNTLAQKIMEAIDVDALEIRESTRSTGRNAGRPPKPIFAQRRPRAETARPSDETGRYRP